MLPSPPHSLTFKQISMLFLAASLGLTGCQRVTESTLEGIIRPVRTYTIPNDHSAWVNSYAAEIKPRIEANLGFRVGGKVIERLVEVGQKVVPGQVLAKIDPQDIQLSEAAARAQLNSAQAERDIAKADLARYTELKDKNFISEAEWQRRQATYDSAEARYQQATSQLKQQQNQIMYSQLRAEAAGIVTTLDLEPGQVVAAGQGVIRVAQTKEKEAHFAVPEFDLNLFKVGQTVQVELGSALGKSVPDRHEQVLGRVREMAAAADAGSRTYTIKVTLLPSADNPLTDWQWGMTATVRNPVPSAISHTAEANLGIRLPLTALLRQGGTAVDSGNTGGRGQVFVFDASKNTVQAQTVTVQAWEENHVLVTSPTLKPGQEVVTAGVHLLHDGQKVKRLVAANESVPATPPVTKAP